MQASLHYVSEHMLACDSVLCTSDIICASTAVSLPSSDVTTLYAMRQVGAPFPVCVCPAAKRRHLESEGAYGKHGFSFCIQFSYVLLTYIVCGMHSVLYIYLLLCPWWAGVVCVLLVTKGHQLTPFELSMFVN